MAQNIEPDLPTNLACLKNVDALLRCPICFEFLNISMMTKCSHNFCSLCIRRFLSYKLQCPVCNTQMTEQDLRNNRILDELVVNFRDAREQLLKANFDSPPISPKMTASAVKCRAASEKGHNSSGTILSHFFQKRHRAPPSKETHQDVQLGGVRTAKTHKENDADLHPGKDYTTACIKEEPADEEITFTPGLMSVKSEVTASQSINAGFEMAHSSTPSKDVKPIIKVECPVCSVSVAQNFINKHLDICLASGEKKESLRRKCVSTRPAAHTLMTESTERQDTATLASLTGSKGAPQITTCSLGNTRRPKAKLVYNLLSTQELKRRLKECHLSVQGSRDQLIKRHQDFVHLHNAQCDSLNPKSVEEIAKEVEANEKNRNLLQRKTKRVMVFTKNQSEKEIDEFHSNYRKQHSSDFSRLIAQVRGRLETTRQASAKPEVIIEKEVQESHSPDQVPESKSCFDWKGEDEEAQPVTEMELSSSPSFSDVSISSSVSDIFGPVTSSNIEDGEKSSVQKRRCSSRGGDEASSPVSGKRRRKT